MIVAMKKVFGIPFGGPDSKPADSGQARTEAKAAIQRAKSKVPLATIQLQMVASIEDLPGYEVERMRYKINNTHSAHGLWILRSDLYQEISKARSQSEAAARINALLPSFQNWIEPQQLTKI